MIPGALLDSHRPAGGGKAEGLGVMKFKLVLLAAAATSMVSGASASAAILVNGSFEQPGGDVRTDLTAHYLNGWTYASGPQPGHLRERQLGRPARRGRQPLRELRSHRH